jgi:hypothetical protein
MADRMSRAVGPLLMLETWGKGKKLRGESTSQALTVLAAKAMTPYISCPFPMPS